MKIFKRILVLCLVLALVALFGAVGFRIYIADHYPKPSTRIVFTEPLTAFYRADPDAFGAYTQRIRVSYDDNKEGNFFAKNLIAVPDAGNLQITLRYNDSTLTTVASRYDLPAVPEAEEGLFSYSLTVSYRTDDPDGSYRTYDVSYEKESEAYMYHYIKLVFDGVDFTDAVWMRVDIRYADREEIFGSIVVCETQVEIDGYLEEYPFKNYRVKKGDLPA